MEQTDSAVAELNESIWKHAQYIENTKNAHVATLNAAKQRATDLKSEYESVAQVLELRVKETMENCTSVSSCDVTLQTQLVAAMRDHNAAKSALAAAEAQLQDLKQQKQQILQFHQLQKRKIDASVAANSTHIAQWERLLGIRIEPTPAGFRVDLEGKRFQVELRGEKYDIFEVSEEGVVVRRVDYEFDGSMPRLLLKLRASAMG